MRFVIPYDNETSALLRGYLRNAGFSASKEAPKEGAYLVLFIEERTRANVLFDSVDSELEAALLSSVRQRCCVLVDTLGGQVQSDSQIRVVLPSEQREQIALALYEGILRFFERQRSPIAPQPATVPVVVSTPPKPWHRRWYTRFFPLLLALAASSAAFAQQPKSGPASTRNAELTIVAPAKPGIATPLATGGLLLTPALSQEHELKIRNAQFFKDKHLLELLRLELRYREVQEQIKADDDEIHRLVREAGETLKVDLTRFLLDLDVLKFVPKRTGAPTLTK